MSSYVLTVRRIDGSILKTTTVADEPHAHAIAELWARQLRCTTTSEPPIPYLGSIGHKPKYPGREPRDFRAVDPCA